MVSLEVSNKPKIKYNDIVDIEKIMDVYHHIKLNIRKKQKILKFEFFQTANIITIYTILKEKRYTHGKYNIFLIIKPKSRIIMGEKLSDKIINHVISKYVLNPAISPRLIDTNVATRKNKGTSKAVYYIKKYINSLKVNNDKIYALKCDVYKFFYCIDHEILLKKLSNIIEDKDLMNMLTTIIESTDREYINEEINKIITRQKQYIKNLKISNREKELKYLELDRLPLYQKGKGLPIGNMSSQIMAIFYLNDLDHYIKEKLHIKYYVRYMDDLVLFHPDREYLKYCLVKIKERLSLEKLKLNNKTQIYELHQGLSYLGYKFILKDKKLYTLISTKTKARIKKNLKRQKLNITQYQNKKLSYKGFYINTDSRNFWYKL